MQEGQKRKGSTAPDCHSKIKVQRCLCGNYHLHYHYVNLAIGKQTLFLIMEECFRYENACALSGNGISSGHGNFVIMLGFVTLTVTNTDFAAFSKAVNDAVTEELGIARILGEPLSNE